MSRAAVSREVYAGLVGEGLAHAGTYSPLTGGPVPLQVMVSRHLDQLETGSDARALTEAYVLSIPRSQLVTAMRGDSVTLNDGRTFKVLRRIRTDESRWYLLCQA